ncbi:hypothetical protein RO3G_05259 [Rhizopus delemar RA 99-880]|uniref:Uncharacterized protein n=1 Tax=Rhizopus delemar (strain RA 99-880 / ATCC MYA-4621 / FGSC 9543 / NRRL 43880) TaxID=246409 RepID=I1BWH4_RHIO9|nr:hypothetical protein RO3G_05259 [Rhizopus delemar RA 99-880]|eukprot:EIE80554.1 hypothetical protein RO3G_05259 [Rhizopus delemar RA 99-880]
MFVYIDGVNTLQLTVILPGGGWLEINSDDPTNTIYQAYYADGSPYSTKLTKTFLAHL